MEDNDPSFPHKYQTVDRSVQRDNNLDDVMRLIAKTIASVNPSPSRPWTQRVVLGIWSVSANPSTR